MLVINRKDNLYLKYSGFIFRYDYFKNFNQFCNHAEPLELEGYQLSGEFFEGYVSQIITDNVQLDIAQRNCLMRTNGISPVSWVFGIPMRQHLSVTYDRAYSLDERCIAINPIQAEFSLFQIPYTGWFVINFSDEYLHNLCQELHLPDPEDFIGDCHNYSPVVIASKEKVEHLRQVCESLFQVAFNLSSQDETESLLSVEFIQRSLEEDVAPGLLLAIAEAKQIMPKEVLLKRASVLKQAEEFMMTNLKTDLRVKDICQKTGVSQRTLEYTFKHFYKLSPKAYYKLLRLNHLNKHLHQKPPETKVSEIATDFGFMHRGQFASDYKKLFGELPSKTLKKGVVI